MLNLSVIRSLLILLFPLFSYGQTFEITDGQSMCMIGKGVGQDATINPYAANEFSYAVIENLSSIEFEIRIESVSKVLNQVVIHPNGFIAVKLIKGDILYVDSLTIEKVIARISYYEDKVSALPLTSTLNKTTVEDAEVLNSFNSNPKPLYVLDGVIVSSIDTLKPSSIAEIFVLKGQKAINKYGLKGEHGVVEIYLKTE